MIIPSTLLLLRITSQSFICKHAYCFSSEIGKKRKQSQGDTKFKNISVR